MINRNKTKIINLLYHPPGYESYRNSPRPEINWDTPDGNWVGIWGYDWPDIIGNEVLKITDKFDYEVWQPDLRADKIYSNRFENGLVHRLFPAKLTYKLHLLKFKKVLLSQLIIKQLLIEGKNKNIIVNLNSHPLNPLTLSVIKIGAKIGFKISLTLHGNIENPYLQFKMKTDFINKIYKLYKLNVFIKYIMKCNHISYQNNTQKRVLDDIHYENSSFVTMGCDFNYWKPTNRKKAKNTFLIASRFVPLKQIDKVINVFVKLKDRYNFKLYIAGHGENEYEIYLQNISKELGDKVVFLGYLDRQKMLAAYESSNIFISTSTSEGCSVAVIKAMATGLSIFSTNVGETANILAENNAGILVEPYNYNQWEKELISVLEGKEIKTLERKVAKEYFHWPNIADKFVKVYKKLSYIS